MQSNPISRNQSLPASSDDYSIADTTGDSIVYSVKPDDGIESPAPGQLEPAAPPHPLDVDIVDGETLKLIHNKFKRLQHITDKKGPCWYKMIPLAP